MFAFLISVTKFFTKVQWLGIYSWLSQSERWVLIRSQGLGEPLPVFANSHGNMTILLAFCAANIPQVVLSYLYTSINNLFNFMLGMAEWTSYYAATTAMGLRVSNRAEGSAQTSTYFLTLPFRWALPTLIFFTPLHRLTSQMVLAARIEQIGFNGQVDQASSVTGVYYSPVVTIAVVCLSGVAMIALLMIARLKRFAKGAPLAGNCSASIAAACQPSVKGGAFEPGIELQKLRWGVVDLPNDLNDGSGMPRSLIVMLEEWFPG